MGGNSIQPLDSYRIGNYQMPVPCYLCEGNNLFDAEFCRHCSAPMALMRAVDPKTNRGPELLAALGADGVGKTVFLGLLMDLLSRQQTEMDFMTCDASTVTMQQQTISHIYRGEFPPSTSLDAERWNWARCRISRRTSKKSLDVFLGDMSGPAILQEIDEPKAFPSITGTIRQATGIFLLLDAQRLHVGDKDEDYFAMKILSYVARVVQQKKLEASEAAGKKGRNRQNITTPPVAVVMMKADSCEQCVENPTEFVQGNLPGLWKMCQNQLSHVNFFAASAVGCCAPRVTYTGESISIPLRVEPRGIIEPFRWLAGNLQNA